MLSLKQFRDRAKGAADLYNYAALVDEGLVLCKDGSLLAGFFTGARQPKRDAGRAQLSHPAPQRRARETRRRFRALDRRRAPAHGRLSESLGLLLSGRGDARHRRGAPPAVSRRRRTFRNRVCAACELHAAASGGPSGLPTSSMTTIRKRKRKARATARSRRSNARSPRSKTGSPTSSSFGA